MEYKTVVTCDNTSCFYWHSRYLNDVGICAAETINMRRFPPLEPYIQCRTYWVSVAAGESKNIRIGMLDE